MVTFLVLMLELLISLHPLVASTVAREFGVAAFGLLVWIVLLIKELRNGLGRKLRDNFISIWEKRNRTGEL